MTAALILENNGWQETAFVDDEFVLDMRVIETTTPLVSMSCQTSDGCGSTCKASACTTSANDPF